MKYENQIIQGDSLEVLKTLDSEIVDCCITSPPYWGLRDYGVEEQLGLEKTPEEYVAKLVEVFREVRRVLKKDGVMFLNLGDSYAGSGKGRNGDGSPGKTESLNKNNRGSMSGVILPSNAKRGDAYDISDKAQEDYQKSDCLCQNLCDECLAALCHSPHTFRERVSKPPPLLSESIREHRELPNDRLPTSGSLPRLVRTAVSIQESPTSVSREVVLDVVLQESTKRVSFLRHPIENHQLGSSSASQDEANEKNPDGVESSDKRVCICGTVLTVHPLCRCKSGISSLHKTYLHSTTMSLKPKDLVGIPWRVALSLQADGWYLRQDIIWAKPNPMPESVTDRCTKSHEYVFLLSKSPKYYFDNEAIKEPSVGSDPRMIDGFVPKSENGKHKGGTQSTTNRKKYEKSMAGGGTSMMNHNGYLKEDGTPIGEAGTRNKRSVWTITTKGYSEAHFATFPKDLIEPMVLAGCPKEVCNKCGKGRERITKMGEIVSQGGSDTGKLAQNKETINFKGGDISAHKFIQREHYTTGFTDCSCDAGFIGGIVLDPFMGSGTTALVAKLLGRKYVGVELNPEYIKIAEKRLLQDLLL